MGHLNMERKCARCGHQRRYHKHGNRCSKCAPETPPAKGCLEFQYRWPPGRMTADTPGLTGNGGTVLAIQAPAVEPEKP